MREDHGPKSLSKMSVLNRKSWALLLHINISPAPVLLALPLKIAHMSPALCIPRKRPQTTNHILAASVCVWGGGNKNFIAICLGFPFKENMN